MHFLMFYDFTPDYLERRGQFRTEHLQLAWDAHARGELIIAGAMSDPADMSALMFSGDSADVAERFARADPYVINGLVTKYTIRQWNTVVGDTAFAPIKL